MCQICIHPLEAMHQCGDENHYMLISFAHHLYNSLLSYFPTCHQHLWWACEGMAKRFTISWKKQNECSFLWCNFFFLASCHRLRSAPFTIADMTTRRTLMSSFDTCSVSCCYAHCDIDKVRNYRWNLWPCVLKDHLISSEILGKEAHCWYIITVIPLNSLVRSII